MVALTLFIGPLK